MKFPVVIKQSPYILLKRIIQVEFVIGLVIFLFSFVINYQRIYTPIRSVFGSNLWLVLVGSLMQLVITFFVFLSWHNEEYRLKEREIIHRRGIIFSRERSILLKNISSVEYKRGVFEFLFGYGSIVLWNGHGNRSKKDGLVIPSVETPEIYADMIKDAIDLTLENKKVSEKKTSILDLILEGEHSGLELKQTLRYDEKSKDVNKALEKAVMKTVAAFLNAEGGSLIIGVTDKAEVYGLENDYHTLVRKDRDGFENHFNMILKNMIGAEFRQYVHISFEKIEDKDVCLVEVEPAPKPVYLKIEGTEEFFIRTGNSTSQLKISEVNSYIESRWKK